VASLRYNVAMAAFGEWSKKLYAPDLPGEPPDDSNNGD